MSRRKHLLQSMDQEVEPPGEGQHIVRAVGSRGSNLIEVEFPDGRTALCLLPAKFHKKLWVKKGNYLVVEGAAEEDTRVTGEISAVLFADHVKQLKRMPGVWPPEFEVSSRAAASQAAEQLAALGVAESDSEEGSAAAGGRGGAGTAAAAPAAAAPSAAAVGEAAAGCAAGEGADNPDSREQQGDEYSSSEDDLPPIPKFNNRRVVEYEVSDSESEAD